MTFCKKFGTIPTVSFSINKVKTVNNVSTGTRYEGKNPNNYIWFNNELWRIIGVFDENSHGQSNTNLVKIIREDSIGGLAWDKSQSNDWTTASLNSLLNGAYYNAQDGTDSGYCYTECNDDIRIKANCDYTTNGIQDGYRGMIQNVTWFLGGYAYYDDTLRPSTMDFYIYERENNVYNGRATSTTGYIGLMYPSDYGYSVLSSNCARTTYLDDYYRNSSCGGQSWISGNSKEWLITPESDSSYKAYVLYVANSDYFTNYVDTGNMVRPVLYLKSDVYYIDGDGSEADPIIIGM